MGDIQAILDAEIAKLPRTALSAVVQEKLKAACISITPETLEHLIEHLFSGNSEPFTWDDGQDTSRDIQITADDLNEVKRRVDRFVVETAPKLMGDLVVRIATGYLKSLKRRWPKEGSLQAKDHGAFARRLERRWRTPLRLLKMLLTISREFGAATFRDDPGGPPPSALRTVLMRLHVRACQVTAEIITLLENGYADGAMARWRTLHEIGVVATFIAEAGEETAQRYIEHQKVEALRGLEEYLKCYKAIGYEPFSEASQDEIKSRHAEVIQTYGVAFDGPYGWAAAHLDNNRARFHHLEAAVDRTEMRSHYKLASYNVHAGPHGAFFRLGLLGGTSGYLAGASNAGMAEPGQNASHTLTQISALLLGLRKDLDQMVSVQIMVMLRGETSHAFAQAAFKLEQDDERYRAHAAASPEQVHEM